MVNNRVQVTQKFAVRASYKAIYKATGAPTGFSTEPVKNDNVSWTKQGYTAVIGQLERP